MGQAALAMPERSEVYCLLVEDSKFDQRRVTRLLSDAGPLQVAIAETIAEAKTYLNKYKFDLLVLDNALPDGLGVDFAQTLRTDHRHAKLPILMVSDFPSPFVYDKATAARIAMVLGKDEVQPKHIRQVCKLRGKAAPSRFRRPAERLS